MVWQKVPLEQRFWTHVRKDESGCWLWIGAKGRNGYGKTTVWIDGKECCRTTHRVSFFLRTGRWAEQNVLHRCDTPLCVNPEHLFEGSAADNVHDMDSKGRRNPALGVRAGERSGRAKLTAAEVLEIRKCCAAGGSRLLLARKFGVDRSTIGCIARRLSWSTLHDEAQIAGRPVEQADSNG